MSEFFEASFPSRVEERIGTRYVWKEWTWFKWLGSWLRKWLTIPESMNQDRYTVETITFDTVREAIYKSKQAMEDIWGRKGRRVLLSHEHYYKCVEVDVQIAYGCSKPRLFQLEVILCPWYKGEPCVF